MIFHPHFHFNSFPEREREREREREERAQIRERVREEKAQIGEHRSSIAPLVGRSHCVDERRDQWDRAVRSSGRSHRSSIDERCDRWAVRGRQAVLVAPLIAPVVARRTAHRTGCRSSHRDRTGRRSSVIHFLLLGFGFFCLIWCILLGFGCSLLMIFFWVVACVFLDLCFPSSFPNTRKYFPENLLKCNQTPGNIFLFRILAFNQTQP